MKKSLLIALGTVIIALGGRTGYAEAPFIGDVPDVVIGDNGENLTVDLNFFRYMNAFNLLNFVQDVDSDSAAMRAAFREQAQAAPSATDLANDISINGKTQIGLSQLADPSTWGSSELTAGGTSFWMSFRDLIRSPGTSTPTITSPFPNPREAGTNAELTTKATLPWHNSSNKTVLTEQDEADRYRPVYLFVADDSIAAANVASRAMSVFSVNLEDDSLSGGFSTVFTDDFATTHWTSSQEGFTQYQQATMTTGSGYLAFTGPGTASTGGAAWNRWRMTVAGQDPAYYSPIAHIDGSLIYCARMTLSPSAQSAGYRGLMPTIRFGAQNTPQIFVTMNKLSTMNYNAQGALGYGGTAAAPGDEQNPQIPAIGTERTYNIYWATNGSSPSYNDLNYSGTITADLRRWTVFFDMVDVDSDNADGGVNAGTWQLTGLEIGTLPRPETIAAGSTLTFTLTDLVTGFSSDTRYTTNCTITPNVPNAGDVQFTAASGGGAVAVYQKNNVAPWIADTVLRITARLSTASTTARGNFHKARVRHNLAFPWMSQLFMVKRSTDIESVVTTSPGVPAVQPSYTDYEIYLPAYGGPNTLIQAAGALLPNCTSFQLGLDETPNGDTDATIWSAEQVMYEVLDDPDSQPI